MSFHMRGKLLTCFGDRLDLFLDFRQLLISVLPPKDIIVYSCVIWIIQNARINYEIKIFSFRIYVFECLSYAWKAASPASGDRLDLFLDFRQLLISVLPPKDIIVYSCVIWIIQNARMEPWPVHLKITSQQNF